MLGSVEYIPLELAEPSDAGGPASTPAGRVVVLGAGAAIEASFPDTDTARPAETAKLRYQWYQKALDRLIAAAKAIREGGTPEGSPDVMPAYAFPQAYSPVPRTAAETSDPRAGVSMTTWQEVP